MFPNAQLCSLITGILDRSIASNCQKLLQTPWQRRSPTCIQRGQLWPLHAPPPPGSGLCGDHGPDHQQPWRNGVLHTDRHFPPVCGHSRWRHAGYRCTCCKSIWPEVHLNFTLWTHLNTHSHCVTPCSRGHRPFSTMLVFPAVFVEILVSCTVDRKNIMS